MLGPLLRDEGWSMGEVGYCAAYPNWSAMPARRLDRDGRRSSHAIPCPRKGYSTRCILFAACEVAERLQGDSLPSVIMHETWHPFGPISFSPKSLVRS